MSLLKSIPTNGIWSSVVIKSAYLAPTVEEFWQTTQGSPESPRTAREVLYNDLLFLFLFVFVFNLQLSLYPTAMTTSEKTVNTTLPSIQSKVPFDISPLSRDGVARRRSCFAGLAVSIAFATNQLRGNGLTFLLSPSRAAGHFCYTTLSLHWSIHTFPLCLCSIARSVLTPFCHCKFLVDIPRLS